MDERATHANAHAARARATRSLPLISASHHRALQLLLATEAHDILLTPEQRKNARTLQSHYHQQYMQNCLHKESESTSTTQAQPNLPAAGPSRRRIVDRVRQRVDAVLERKRTNRGFTSAIRPDEGDISDYTMCLSDLAALSCDPELDSLPAPASLELLQARSKQLAEAAEAAAQKNAVQDPVKVEAYGEDDPMADDTLPNALLPASAIPVVIGASTEPVANGLQARNNQQAVVVTAASDITKDRDSAPTVNFASAHPTTAPTPPTVPPPPSNPKYSMYTEDDGDEERVDPVPVPDYRPVNNFANGLDRPSKKRLRPARTNSTGENGARPMQFITAKEQLAIEEQQEEEKRANHYMNRGSYIPPSSNPYNISGATTNNHGSPAVNPFTNGATPNTTSLKSKILGTKRPKFKSPINKSSNNDDGSKGPQSKSPTGADEPVDDRLRNIDPKMIEAIKNEIMESYPVVTWDDISGLEHAKKTIKETITWPMLRPDIFTGLRRPPKGLLLFGPPGTGKTMIGKCIASQSKATFFSISSSSLTSKWIGDGEKMVRALFAVARCHQPAVIFMDEIDSLLTQRSDGEVEASRRIKTEFLVQFDGVGVGGEEDRILIVGATNRPQEIDEAARRRFQKRLYIPLPENQGRHGLILKLLEKQPHNMTAEQILDICERTAGYSGSDMTGLCREAALGPVRAIQGDILDVDLDALRPINHGDFVEALSQVRASVSDRDLDLYKAWDMEYGSVAKG
ncbi:hypothetical protein BGZ72_000803 [Mortierella alpina]|nr:hypothetical protein BGZ72_000803 [Mortierella alpina]